MNAKSHREEELFEEALSKRSDAERAAFLDGACRDDPHLRARMDVLLEGHLKAEGFLEHPPVHATGGAGGATVLVPVTEKPGDRIGRYKLLQQIGEGGCGVVYMAEQEEPVRRRVALKVIKLGMDTRNVIARFEAERQALALMDHPNIAKVLDAGATETGRSYFVMELVRGIKITDYCDQNNLSTRERLDLFIQVCHAIQHAHQKGIIHRDIKPSNILVSLHDGVPVPVVIDFGIAKATEQRLTDKTLFTAFEQFIGTPAYMSPEQAELSRLDIDTRSDIYSLGVLLYELLTGKTPFDPKTLLAAGLDEMRRTIREQEPVRPSTRLTQELVAASRQSAADMAGPECGALTRRRYNQIQELIHLVRGDLDWIVMKCLEKNRTRRYETANGLALDIERHLNHEPVDARPQSTAYRIQKFVRRNKVMVMAGTAIAAAIVMGVVVSTWQAVRATRAEREQGRLRIKAEVNEQKALQAQANEAKEREMAEAERDRARLEAYAADMFIADTAWRERNLGQAMTALQRQIPKPGDADLRGIEWRYLWQKCQGQQSAIFNHEAEVTCAELSPDGNWLATQSGDTFWIWDMTRKGERRALSTGAPRNEMVPGEHLAFDPLGRFLATATSSGVLIWDLTDWRKLPTLAATNASLCFSGDGSRLATFGEEGIQMWNTGTWELLVRLGDIDPGSKLCPRIALNWDGSLLAVSCQQWVTRNEPLSGEEVRLWKIPQRQVPQRQFLIKGNEISRAQKLAFSNDNRWLAACSLGPPAEVWLWSLPEGKRVAHWPVSAGQGGALAFAPDGKSFATAGTDQMISLWETVHTNRQGSLMGHLNDVCSLRFAAGDRLVSASKDKTVRIWSAKPVSVSTQEFVLPVEQMIFPPTTDVHRIVSVNLSNLTFEQWDIESGKRLRQKKIQGANTILQHGNFFDGTPLQKGLMRNCFIFDERVQAGVGSIKHLFILPGAESSGWDLCAVMGDGHVYAWNADSGELVYSNKVAARLVTAGPMAGNKQLVLIEDMEGRISSYDLRTHERRLIEEHAVVGPSVLPVSPDGRFLGYLTTNSSVNVSVKVWDAITKQTRSIATLPISPMTTLTFSPDSRCLAVATSGGWVQVWNASTGRSVIDPLAGHLTGTWKVNFSVDSKLLVTYGVDCTAKIWNIATGRVMLSGLPLNWHLVNHLHWNLLPPDGNSVIESADERTIRLVRLPTLAEIDALEKVR